MKKLISILLILALLLCAAPAALAAAPETDAAKVERVAFEPWDHLIVSSSYLNGERLDELLCLLPKTAFVYTDRGDRHELPVRGWTLDAEGSRFVAQLGVPDGVTDPEGVLGDVSLPYAGRGGGGSIRTSESPMVGWDYPLSIQVYGQGVAAVELWHIVSGEAGLSAARASLDGLEADALGRFVLPENKTLACTLPPLTEADAGDWIAMAYTDDGGAVVAGLTTIRLDPQTYTVPPMPASAPATEQEVYDRMLAMKPYFPEGMHWTNDDFYSWHGGYYSWGAGCAGFAFLLSDAAFGRLPARFIYEIDYDALQVGDILRVNHDMHSVVVMERYPTYIVLAEGNWNSSIHWGRIMTRDSVLKTTDYVITRYPEPTPGPTGFYDVPEGAYYCDPVLWAVEHGVTNGIDEKHFGPDNGCTRGQVVTFLWRAAGSPEPETEDNPFADVSSADYYYKPVLWAAENGITSGTGEGTFSPNDTCTRGQIVTFLWRAQGQPEPETAENPFGDVEDGAYFYRAVLWAAESNITKGTSATAFSPSATCTRGQVVTFLYRSVVD